MSDIPLTAGEAEVARRCLRVLAAVVDLHRNVQPTTWGVLEKRAAVTALELRGAIKRLANDGLVKMEPGRIVPTPAGVKRIPFKEEP